MLKRHEMGILLKAGHPKTEVARLREFPSTPWQEASSPTVLVANQCRSQTSFQLCGGVRCRHRSGTNAGVCLPGDPVMLGAPRHFRQLLSRH
jgi:hypothetical protein